MRRSSDLGVNMALQENLWCCDHAWEKAGCLNWKNTVGALINCNHSCVRGGGGCAWAISWKRSLWQPRENCGSSTWVVPHIRWCSWTSCYARHELFNIGRAQTMGQEMSDSGLLRHFKKGGYAPLASARIVLCMKYILVRDRGHGSYVIPNMLWTTTHWQVLSQ